MTINEDDKSQSNYINQRHHNLVDSHHIPMPATTLDISGMTNKKINTRSSSNDTFGGCRVNIEDPRQLEHFAGVTFSLYKRSQVKKTMIDAMSKGSIEEANYWGAELICCGCFLELWDALLEFMGRHINTSNPKLPVILAKCFQDFKDIAMGEYSTDQLSMRNSNKVRKLMAKVISILCLSRKRGRLEYVKIDKDNDFDILKLSSRMKAPSVDFSKQVIQEGDPTEVYVAINEFCYHISKNIRNPLMADYWIEWLLEFDKKCRKKKERCQCARREFAPQGDDAGKDIIFIIWDAIIREAKNRSQKAISTIINSILELYKIKFSSGVKKKRRHLLYFSVALLCEAIDLSLPTIQSESALVSVLENLDIVYTQVKQGEITEIPDLPKRKTKKSVMTEKEKKAAHKLDVLVIMGID